MSARHAVCASTYLCALLTSLPQPALAQRPPGGLSTTDIARLARPATTTITTLDAQGDTLGQGSGFFLERPGMLVTNWHVLRGAVTAVVSLANGDRYDVIGFLRGDSVADVVLLEVPGIQVLPLAPRAAATAVGEPVVAIGSPLGLPATVSVGIVSAFRVVDGVDVIQVSVPLGPGSSGAPLLDTRGRVLGIVTGFAEGAQHIGFATPVGYATRLLNGTRAAQPLGTRFSGRVEKDQPRGLAVSTPIVDRNGLRADLESAERGDADAQYRVALRYAAGFGVERDDAVAAAWFRKAAEQDHARAQHKLGVMYAVGTGTNRDDRAAVRWLTRAAEAGVTRAQHDLGMLYGLGEGVPRDPVEAYKWLTLAAIAGSHKTWVATAVSMRESLARHMSPSQIAEARSRAAEWQRRLTRN